MDAKGAILNLASTGDACMAGLTNSEAESNHKRWSEMKTSLNKSWRVVMP